MNKLLRFLVGLSVLMFFAVGIGWIAAPLATGEQFGMPLLTGVGLSTQVGDLGAMFLTLAATIFMALKTGKKLWYYAPAMLLGLAAVNRILAWLIHGAAFATNLIAVEVLFALILFLASRKLTEGDQD